MTFKFIVFAALVAVAKAGVVGYNAAPAYAAGPAYAAAPAAYAHAPAAYARVAAPVAYAPAPAAYARVAAPVAYAAAPIAKAPEAYDPNPQYSYGYDIQDGLTGDSKSQHETRNGDVVTGSYSVIDPDGTKRTVEYTADPQNGFNAVVHKEPLGVPVKAVAAAPVARVAAPVAYAAPVARYPAAYAAPGHVGYAATPVAKYAAAPVGYAAPVAKYYR